MIRDRTRLVCPPAQAEMSAWNLASAWLDTMTLWRGVAVMFSSSTWPHNIFLTFWFTPSDSTLLWMGVFTSVPAEIFLCNNEWWVRNAFTLEEKSWRYSTGHNFLNKFPAHHLKSSGHVLEAVLEMIPYTVFRAHYIGHYIGHIRVSLQWGGAGGKLHPKRSNFPPEHSSLPPPTIVIL